MTNDERWNQHYLLAKSYYETYGDLKIVKTYQVNHFCLGGWIITQRKKYREGKLTPEQIRKLNEIEMIWQPQMSWMDYYRCCLKFYQTHQNLMVTKYDIVNGVALSEWLNVQRYYYRIGKLTDKQISLLNELNMIWDIHNRISWNEYYELAKEYYETHGNLQIPLAYQVGEIKLGEWLHNQRMAYHGKNKMRITEEKILLLEQIGIKWRVYKIRNLKLYDGYAFKNGSQETKHKVKTK